VSRTPQFCGDLSASQGTSDARSDVRSPGIQQFVIKRFSVRFRSRACDIAANRRFSRFRRTSRTPNRVTKYVVGAPHFRLHATEPLDRLDRVLLRGVDGELGAELARKARASHRRRRWRRRDRRRWARTGARGADAEHGNEVRQSGAGDLDGVGRWSHHLRSTRAASWSQVPQA
jgi:hypothetical protein